MTTLTFHLSRALGRLWTAGDEIVVTEMDHHANVDPWKAVAQERGLTIRTVPMNPEEGRLDWDALVRAINTKTRLVAIGAASNALGTINDVHEAVSLAHDAGALAFVDAVHYASHALVDAAAWGCDFLACSAYKFYGPHVGVLCGREDLLNEIDFPKLVPAPDPAPERVETGTQNHEGIVGTAAAVAFLASLSDAPNLRSALATTYDGLHQRGARLLDRLWHGLVELDAVSLYGLPPDAARTPTLVFTVDGITSEAVSAELAKQGLFLSHGDFYAATVVERLQVEGLVRAGCACYTTEQEVDRLIGAVRSIVAGT